MTQDESSNTRFIMKNWNKNNNINQNLVIRIKFVMKDGWQIKNNYAVKIFNMHIHITRFEFPYTNVS